MPLHEYKNTAIVSTMAKRPFIRRQKKKRHGTNFWDREYTKADHLALSTNPSEDFLKFLRYLRRHHNHLLTHSSTAVDLGCGNGRQLKHLLDTYQMTVHGYDTSSAAIQHAIQLCNSNQATLLVRSIADPLPLPDESCDLALDMMTSHFLNTRARLQLRNEIHRVLQANGLLLMKTFLRDEDLHTRRLLKEHPGPEPNSYIHPIIGVPEYVYSERELKDFLEPHFIIHRIYRSHQHRSRGKALKRRTITVYAEKNERV